MPVESGSFIEDLNPAWPLGASDDIAQGDDHLRLIKRFVQQSFPEVGGSVNVSHTEMNQLAGISTGQTIQQQINDLKNAGVGPHNHAIADVTGLQSALNAKAALTSPSFSGVPTAPTASSGNSSAQLATTAFVQTAVNNISIPDVPEYTPPTQCRFFPVNTSNQISVANVDTYNVGFDCVNFAAGSQVQILYSFRGYWEGLQLKTDSNGMATFSLSSAGFRADWLGKGGPLGSGYFRIRAAADTSLQFTQNVQIT
jgi:hypothetical protein